MYTHSMKGLHIHTVKTCKCSHIALFPGPAQLSVTCIASDEKLGGGTRLRLVRIHNIRQHTHSLYRAGYLTCAHQDGQHIQTCQFHGCTHYIDHCCNLSLDMIMYTATSPLKLSFVFPEPVESFYRYAVSVARSS